jgi:hypothetical protein
MAQALPRGIEQRRHLIGLPRPLPTLRWRGFPQFPLVIAMSGRLPGGMLSPAASSSAAISAAISGSGGASALAVRGATSKKLAKTSLVAPSRPSLWASSQYSGL